MQCFFSVSSTLNQFFANTFFLDNFLSSDIVPTVRVVVSRFGRSLRSAIGRPAQVVKYVLVFAVLCRDRPPNNERQFMITFQFLFKSIPSYLGDRRIRYVVTARPLNWLDLFCWCSGVLENIELESSVRPFQNKSRSCFNNYCPTIPSSLFVWS